jgi:hypothetical protein
MTQTEQPVPTPERDDQLPGLPMKVLNARARLGPTATPEEVAEHLRSNGMPDVTADEVRDLWDEGHLPG